MTDKRTSMRTDLDSGPGAMARGAGINLVGSVATMPLAFLVTYVITQFLSVQEVGFLTIGSTVIGLALIAAMLGLQAGAVRFVARGAALDDERLARGSAQVAIAVVTLTSTALASLLWWQTPWLTEEFFRKPDATPILRIIILSLPGLALMRVMVASLQGFGMMGYTARCGIAIWSSKLAAVCLLLALGFGAQGAAVGYVAAEYVGLAAAVFFLLRVHPLALVPARGAWQAGKMLLFSIPQTLSAVLFWAVVWTDTLLLGRLGTAAEVGIYGVATRLLGPANSVSTAVGQMFAPRIAAQDARGDRETLAIMLKRVTYWNTAVSIPIFSTLALVPGPLLSLFGETYAAGATALAILAIGQLLDTAGGPLGVVINMSGRPYINMMNNALVAGVNVALCFLLIPRYGMVGASLSFAISLGLVRVLTLVQVRVLFGIYPFRPDTLRVLAAAGIAVGLAAPLVYLPNWPSPVWEAVVGTGVIFVAYVQMLRALGLSPEDKELFAAGRAKIGRRLRPRTSR